VVGGHRCLFREVGEGTQAGVGTTSSVLEPEVTFGAEGRLCHQCVGGYGCCWPVLDLRTTGREDRAQLSWGGRADQTDLTVLLARRSVCLYKPLGRTERRCLVAFLQTKAMR
jgi:hypothetical protein